MALSPDGIYIAGDFSSAGSVDTDELALWNGSAWEAVPSPGSAVQLLAYANSTLFAVTRPPSTIAEHVYSWDGAGWNLVAEVRTSCCSQPTVSSIASIGADSVAMGGDFTSINGNVHVGLSALTPTGWDSLMALASGPFGFEEAQDAVHTIELFSDGVYVAGEFNTLGDGDARRVAHLSSGSWIGLGSGLGGDSYDDHESVRDLVEANGSIYAAGRFDSSGTTRLNNIARWTGVEWAALGGGLGTSGNDMIYSVQATPDGLLYAGGVFEDSTLGISSLAVWDGLQWASVGGGISGYVNTMVVSATGDLYAGGYFDSVGTVPAKSIARWDGAAWHALDGGVEVGIEDALTVESAVPKLEVYPNPAIRSITIVVGGDHGNRQSVLVHDVLGRVVARRDQVFGLVEIDVSALASGLYFVRAGDGKRWTNGTFVRRSGS